MFLVQVQKLWQPIAQMQLFFVFFALFAKTLQEPATVWYFKSAPSDLCPAGVTDEKCLVLSQTLHNLSAIQEIFTSNVILAFLGGDHVLNFQGEEYLTYQDIENVTFLGSPERAPNAVGILSPVSRIVCKSPFTLLFINISQLSFENITIHGCGSSVNNYIFTETFEVQTNGIHLFGPGQKVAILLVNIRNFTMIRCLVENSRGYGLLGVNVLGTSVILGSVFLFNNKYTIGRVQCTRPPVNLPDDITACSGGNALFVYEDLPECPSTALQYVLLIRSSVFALGVNGFGGRLNDYFLTRGGTGIGIIMSQSSYGVTVELDNVAAYGNSALMAANIYIAIYEVVDNSSVLVQNSRILQANSGLLSVDLFFEQSQSSSGGFHVDYGIPYLTPTSRKSTCPIPRKFNQEDIVTVVNTLFSENVALLGGGAYYEVRVGVGGAPDHLGSVVRFKLDRCTFINNAGISGTALYFSQQNGLGAGNSELIVSEGVFIDNSYITPVRNLTALYTSLQLNTVQLASAKNATFIDCSFSGSEGSGLSAFGSNINMKGQLSFDRNSGINGGAIDLQDSRIGFSPNTRVTFTNNYALNRGGALHVVGRSDVAQPCFFQIHDPNLLLDPNVTLYFENNFAEEAGSVLYGGSIDRCIVSADSALQVNTSGEVFDYLVDIGPHSTESSTVSSDSLKVCFCINGIPDCGQRSTNVTIFPGATMQVPVVTVGQRLGTTPSSVSAFPSDYTKIGESQQVQQVEKVCTNLTFTVTVTQKQATTSLDVRTNSLAVTGKVVINIELLDCPLGFVHSNITGACECDPTSQSQSFNVTCNINDQTISRVGGSWLNASYHGRNGTYDGILILSNCPFDYCLRQASDVNLAEPDTQCNYNRTGVLCGACKEGLSLTLATSRCIECSNRGLALFLGYLIAAFGLVLVLFTFDLTISCGTLSGLIFYGNLVDTHQAVYFSPGEYNIITVFISWLNLNSGVNICLYNGLNNYARIWLGFIFPLYIWVIVLGIIIASRLSSKIARLTGSKPVSVLATLILLSYNKILNVAIASLSFASILQPDGDYNTVWSIDGNIHFFMGQHIPLGIFAVIVVVLFVIPYTLLLVIVPLPWVQARTTSKFFSWINTLKPFLDAHQGPFKKNFRNWIGILLLIRALLSGLSTIRLGEYNSENIILVVIIVLMFLLICVAWISGGVYSKRSRNILESSFYLNLGILSALTLYARSSTKASQHKIFQASGWVALLELLGILIFHGFRRLDSIRQFHKARKMVTAKVEMVTKRSEISVSDESLTTGTESSIGKEATSTYFEFREPLLEQTL